jgi:hypothetical protein
MKPTEHDLRQTAQVSKYPVRLRAPRLAGTGRGEELATTIEALSAFDEGDWEDHYNLARALASCLPYLEDSRSAVMPAAARTELRRRCAERTLAAFSRSIDLGFRNALSLEYAADFAPIRESPAFRRLIERAKSQRVPVEVRYPVR